MEWLCIELWPDPLGCDDGCMLLWELTLHADSMVRCHENVSRELEALCSPMQSGYMTDGPATTLLEKMCHQAPLAAPVLFDGTFLIRLVNDHEQNPEVKV